MDAFVREPDDIRRRMLQEAQARIGLSPASIEKDLWVCLTLRELFGLPEWGPHLIFKGGTSLSKAWKLIERFSEDIDVVIERDFLGCGGDSLSKKQIKKLVGKCSSRVQQELRPALEARLGRLLPAGARWSLVPASMEEDKDQQTLLFQYPTCFSDAARYVRPAVKIELGARSDAEPFETMPIRPYLAESFPNDLGPSEFPVRTVVARRTFWEKAMLLHEELLRPPERKRNPRLSRHYYDLYCLIGGGEGAKAADDLPLFHRCARHRAVFFAHSWVDYSKLAPGALRIVPTQGQMTEWRQDYEAMKEQMFFGEVPAFDTIIKTVGEFEREFNRTAAAAAAAPPSAEPAQ